MGARMGARSRGWRHRAVAIACAVLVAFTAGCGDQSGGGGGGSAVALAQPVQVPAYFSLDLARATKQFDKQGVALNWALIPGGDAAALAGLQSGDLDFAAVGSQATVVGIAKGQPYEFVYCLDSQLGLQLVASNKLLQRAGVSPSAPVKARLAALKGATIGVSAVGGLQDQVARYYLSVGGLDPDDAKIAQVGPPPALVAALGSGRIDAFVLSPPQGQLVEVEKTGKVLLNGSEVVQIFCDLALVTTKQYAKEHGDAVRRVTRALTAASGQIAQDPDKALQTVHGAYYQKVPLPVMERAKDHLVAGAKGNGRMTPEMMDNVVKFAETTGTELPRALSASDGEGDWWTNEFLGGSSG
jgi:NitT/TauT family transport system substrate-binding protein